jgi:hypothetical protein
MRFRTSLQKGLPGQKSEFGTSVQAGSTGLAAQILEIRQLRHELRVAQCGRLACWDGRSPATRPPKSRRRLVKS